MFDTQAQVLGILTSVGVALFVAWPRRRSRSFLVELQRPRTSSDGWWERAVTALAVGAGLWSLAALVVGAPSGWIRLAQAIPALGVLAGLVRTLLSRGTTRIPSRFYVPSESGPGYRKLLSPTWTALHLVLAGASLAVLLLLPQPGQARGLLALPSFWIFLHVLVSWSFTQERVALSPESPQAHFDLLIERRRLSIRLIETLMTSLSGGFLLLGLSLGLDSLAEPPLAPGELAVLGQLCLGGGIIGSLLYWGPPLHRVSDEIQRIAGTEVLGTRPEGWRLGGLIYWAPEDPIIFVPKQVGMGQTLNFARPQAWVFLGLLVGVPLLIAGLLR